jgi:HEAT repeat protein
MWQKMGVPQQKQVIAFTPESEEPPSEFALKEERGEPTGQAALRRMLLTTYRAYLQAQSWRTRRKGAKGLGELGAAALAAVPELERLLEDEDQRVREAVTIALKRIGRS